MNTQSDKLQGHAKSVAGIVTGNKELQDKGDAETRTANAEGHIDDARDKVTDVVEDIKDKLDDTADKAKDALHHH